VESAAKLISSLASLLWPLIFIVLLYKFFDPIKILIESARSRKFTIKVGGNELTMEEASEQQRVLVSDLQAKVSEMEKRAMSGHLHNSPIIREPVTSNKRILWVDDDPKYNSFVIAGLEDRGVTVITELSTDAALSKIEREAFDIIISDMGRPEGEHAGLDLAKKLKGLGVATPVYIFCGPWAAKNLSEQAKNTGVAGITSSATTLLSMLSLASET
jgi:CheY-like chemotaxis protein